MSLIERLRAESVVAPGAPRCTVCVWLESRADRSEWAAALALTKEEIRHKVIWRAMRDEGFRYGYKPIESHRNAGH